MCRGLGHAEDVSQGVLCQHLLHSHVCGALFASVWHILCVLLAVKRRQHTGRQYLALYRLHA